MKNPVWLLCGKRLILESEVQSIDCSNIEKYYIILHLKNGEIIEVYGVQALEIIEMIRPSAIEGRRFAWIRGAWAIHNLIGHPLMQICAFFGMPRFGVKIHDATIPKAIRP